MKLRSTALLILSLCLVIAFSASAGAREYRLGPGDVLSISLWGSVSQQFSVTVGTDGTFELPMIGRVVAEGKTVVELAAELKELFAVYIKEPNVIVNLTRAREIRVQILGNVRTPGLFSFTAETTLSQALARAGGVTERGDSEAISVQRTSGEVLTVNLKPLLTGVGGEDLDLQDGDTVVVPLGTITVAVIGEVNKPGVYELPRDARLMDALMAAGGPTRTAITNRVTIYEASDLADPQPQGTEIFKGNMQENPTIKQGYVVYVPRNVIWDISLVASILSVLTGIKSLLGL
ncbi:MAG: SLBB domain-containing protein [Bacillota bacterium]|jgi:polysaccharide export outer membrane protein